MDVIPSELVEAMLQQPTMMSKKQESIPISIIQGLDQKFLTDHLIKSVLIRALATLPSVPSSYKCDTCGKSFSSFQALGGHKSSHNAKNKRTRDEETNISITKSRKRPRSSETTTALDKQFECGICSKAFSTYQGLGGHKSTHNTDNKRTRNEPTKTFIAKSIKLSISSQNEPTSEKPFECDICNKTFSSHHALGGHKASHKRVSYKLTTIIPKYLQLFPKSTSPKLVRENAPSLLNETSDIDLELRL